jgi:ankyrin repeat protein
LDGAYVSGKGRARRGSQAVARRNADIEAKDEDGRTALLSATEEGRDAVVKQLLERNADIEAKDLIILKSRPG